MTGRDHLSKVIRLSPKHDALEGHPCPLRRVRLGVANRDHKNWFPRAGQAKLSNWASIGFASSGRRVFAHELRGALGMNSIQLSDRPQYRPKGFHRTIAPLLANGSPPAGSCQSGSARTMLPSLGHFPCRQPTISIRPVSRWSIASHWLLNYS
jgi:hypothetical protein